MNVIRGNLLPSWVVNRRAAFARRRRWSMVVLSAAGVMLLGAAVAPDRDIDLHGLESERDRMRHSVLTLDAAVADQLARQGQLRQSIELSRQASTRFAWSALLLEVWQASQPDTALDLLTVSPVETGSERAIVYEIRIDGLQRSQAAVDKFVLRLDSSPLFTSVRVLNTQRTEGGPAPFTHRFSVRCTIESQVEGPK